MRRIISASAFTHTLDPQRSCALRNTLYYVHTTVVGLTIDLHKNLIQMPLPLGIGTQVLGAFLSDIGGEEGTESIPPIPYRLMADIAIAQDRFPPSQKRKA